MRWFWIDKFIGFESRKSAAAIKNISLAEDHLHDLHPDFPIVPHSLVIEGMAQTAGMLVGEARNFEEKVILAKIAKATFHRLARAGDTIVFRAEIEQLNETGASIRGTVSVRTTESPAEEPLADVEMMFSHIDQNISGMEFPEHNFVFTERFVDLLRTFRMNTRVPL